MGENRTSLPPTLSVNEIQDLLDQGRAESLHEKQLLQAGDYKRSGLCYYRLPENDPLVGKPAGERAGPGTYLREAMLTASGEPLSGSLLEELERVQAARLSRIHALRRELAECETVHAACAALEDILKAGPAPSTRDIYDLLVQIGQSVVPGGPVEGDSGE